METLNLYFEDFEDNDFQLIAIHTIMQDYKLAYLLNKKIGVHLTRAITDVDISYENQLATFSLYQFKDCNNCSEWYMVQNKCTIEIKVEKTEGLFSNEINNKVINLQKELKKSDFLLKIEGDIDDAALKKLVKDINTIKGVVTAFDVDTQKLKNKEYLIF